MDISRILIFYIFYVYIFCKASYLYGFDLIQTWEATKKHSFEYKIARLEADVIIEQSKQAKFLLFPQISLNTSYQNNYSLINPSLLENSSNNNIEYGYNVDLSQKLFNLKDFSEYKRSKIIQYQAETEFNTKEEEILLEVSRVYFDILMLKDSIAAILSAKEVYLKQIEVAKAMHYAEVATKIDIYEAQAAFDRAQADYISLKAKLKSSENQLENLTKLDPSKINSIDEKQILKINFNDNLSYWQNLANNNNVESKYSFLELDSAKQYLKSSRYEHFPSITLNIGFQDKRYESLKTNNSVINTFQNKDRRKGAYASINFSMPIYTGGYISSKVKEAKKKKDKASQLVNLIKSKIQLNIKDSFLGVKNNKIKILAQEKLVDTNIKKFEANQAGLKFGINTIVDVVKAQQELDESRKQLASLRYEFLQSFLTLLKHSGTLELNKNLKIIKELFKK